MLEFRPCPGWLSPKGQSTLTTGKEHVMNEDDAVMIVGYLTRSKAIWKDPVLLALVESAPSPTKAFALVLQKTGSQKKAKAGRWYACAIRDFGKDSLGALTKVLQSPQGAEKLEELILTTFPDLSEEQERRMPCTAIRQ